LVLTEAVAGAYKEFAVVKINKYGVKQERVMGIDRDQVHNMLRAGDGGGLFGSRKVKKQSRNITDIVRVVAGDRPNVVIIEFREGADRLAYTYECRSRADAAEITERLQFLIGLSRRDVRSMTVTMRP
jgi:hypothetical protein